MSSEKVKKIVTKIGEVCAAIAILMFIAFVIYGLKTGCPGVAIYVYCGA